MSLGKLCQSPDQLEVLILSCLMQLCCSLANEYETSTAPCELAVSDTRCIHLSVLNKDKYTFYANETVITINRVAVVSMPCPSVSTHTARSSRLPSIISQLRDDNHKLSTDKRKLKRYASYSSLLLTANSWSRCLDGRVRDGRDVLFWPACVEKITRG